MKHVLCVLLLFVFAGCSTPLARPAKIFLDEVGPEIKAYWLADADLEDDDREVRLLHLRAFRRAVEEANK